MQCTGLSDAQRPSRWCFDGPTYRTFLCAHPDCTALVRDLSTGSFVADQRNVVLIGGTGTGKTYLAIAIARALTGASNQ